MKKCRLCGIDIPDGGNATKYCRDCSLHIRHEKYQQYVARKKAEKARENLCKMYGNSHKSTMQQLYEDAREATRLGMSYGEYVAKKGGRRNG